VSITRYSLYIKIRADCNERALDRVVHPFAGHTY
jgi:hypothetical protein